MARRDPGVGAPPQPAPRYRDRVGYRRSEPRRPSAQVEAQRAVRTPGDRGPAIFLCDAPQEGAILVEERGVTGQVADEEGLELRVTHAGLDHPVPREDAPGGSVHDEDGPAGRVEQD